jgi:hypothetical protein
LRTSILAGDIGAAWDGLEVLALQMPRARADPAYVSQIKDETRAEESEFTSDTASTPDIRHRGMVDAARRHPWHLVALVILVLPLFIYGARWGVDGNMDAIAVDVAAWEVSRSGTLDLSGYEAISSNLEELDRWFLTTESGEVVSNRAPGLIALAIPSYLALSPEPFSVAPGTLIAVIATFLAVLITWRVLLPLVGPTPATVSAFVLALGTTTWAVSSSELWPHAPGQLWAALTILALSISGYWAVGLAQAASITTRPLTAIFAFVIGIRESFRLRSWRPAVRVGLASSVGLMAVIVYNRLVFESWSIRGGYSDNFTTGAVDRFDLIHYAQNVWEMFLGLPNGVLITSPILAVGLIGVIWFRKQIPGWAISALLAGFVYLLVHAALNRASGGAAAFYRYPLEAIVLSAPALTVGAWHLFQRSRVWSRIVVAMATVSVVLQFFNVFYFACFVTDPVVNTCILS